MTKACKSARFACTSLRADGCAGRSRWLANRLRLPMAASDRHGWNAVIKAVLGIDRATIATSKPGSKSRSCSRATAVSWPAETGWVSAIAKTRLGPAFPSFVMHRCSRNRLTKFDPWPKRKGVTPYKNDRGPGTKRA